MSSLSEILPIYNLRIRTPNLLLRAPSLHEQATYIIVGNKEATDTYPGEEAFTGTPQELFAGYLRSLAELCSPKNRWRLELGVFLDQERVGGVALWTREANAETAWSAYGLHKKYRGRGWGREMQAGVLTFLFDVLKINQSRLNIDIRNEPSAGVARSLGYKKDGTEEWDGEIYQRWLLKREDWQREEAKITGADQIKALLLSSK